MNFFRVFSIWLHYIFFIYIIFVPFFWQAIAALSIVSNAGLVFFTRNPEAFSNIQDFKISCEFFLFFQYTAIGIIAVYHCVYKGPPSAVTIQKNRQKVLVNKVVLARPDVAIPKRTVGYDPGKVYKRSSFGNKVMQVFDREDIFQVNNNNSNNDHQKVPSL